MVYNICEIDVTLFAFIFGDMVFGLGFVDDVDCVRPPVIAYISLGPKVVGS